MTLPQVICLFLPHTWKERKASRFFLRGLHWRYCSRCRRTEVFENGVWREKRDGDAGAIDAQ